MINVTFDLKEHEILYKKIKIKYILRENRSDARKLLVIFSGFGFYSDFTYDFVGKSLDSIGCTILWIKDEFCGNSMLYMGILDGNSISDAIYSFIIEISKIIYCQKDDIILLGGSKGGTASLFYGLKYDFSNIISISPQLRFGSYLFNKHKNVFDNIKDSDIPDEEAIKIFDSYIFRNLKNVNNKSKIYIIHSSVDEIENSIDIKNYFKDFRYYSIEVKSDSVYKHNMIVRYSVPIITSIINFIIYNVDFKINNYTYVYTGDADNKLKDNQILKKDIVAKIKNLKIVKDRLYITGTGFIRGCDSSKDELFNKFIILKNDKYTYSFKVKSCSCIYNSNMYFKDIYVNYSTGDFTHIGDIGIDISDIKYGTYDVCIKIDSLEYKFSSTKNISFTDKPLVFAGKHGFYIFFKENDSLKLKFTNFISPYKPNYCTLNVKKFNYPIYHVEGIFITNGIEIINWGDCKFYLILSGRKVYAFELGMNDRVFLNNFLHDYGCYRKSNYCSIGRKGVNLNSCENGDYTVFITQIYNHFLFSNQIDKINLNNK